MKTHLLFLVALILGAGVYSVKAQTVLSGEFRPRAEYRHGVKQLFADNQDAAFFVSQRTRLNLHHTHAKYKFGLSLQDVRVWGDVKQLTLSDKNKVALHQAWGELLFCDNMSLKLGRQELVYDDSRILGNVGWAQQARSHDLALLKTKIADKSQLHIGLALNNDKESLLKSLYQTSYKNMQFAWYHFASKKFDISLLALNVGQEKYNADSSDTEINYSQTLGTFFNYRPSKLSLTGAAYMQTGKNKGGQDLSAYMFDINLQYPLAQLWKAKVGMQWLSGTDSDELEDDHSFAPLFGTNHKFNGHMDYFYVGNHAKNVGLVDIHATISYAKNKFAAGVTAHVFSAQAKLYDAQAKEADAYLGTEIDMSCTYKYSKDVHIKAGYSQMFATDSMELLKGGDASEMQNWAWLMIVLKPTFFASGN